MKYTLLMCASESNVPQIPGEPQAAASAWQAFVKEMEAAGGLLSSSGRQNNSTG